MQQIIDINFLILASVIFFTTSVSYGNLLLNFFSRNQREINIFYSSYWGAISIFILQVFLYIFFSINIFTNLLILAVGQLYFIKNFKSYKLDFLLFLKILFFTFIILIISKTHEDFKHRHLQTISYLFDNKLMLGKGNINPQFIYTPTLSYVITILQIPFYENKLFHIPVYIFFVSFIGYCLKEITSKNKNSFLFSLIIIFSIVYFKSLKKFGFDVPALFVALVAYFELSKSNTDNFREMLLYVFSISIKITTVFALPIFIYYFIKNLYLKKIVFKKFLITTIFCIIVISSNFLNNGCIVYVIKKSCLNQNIVSWSINPDIVSEISSQTELDTKGYYTQNKINKVNFLKNFNWFETWLKNNFFYKISDFLLIYTLIILIFLFLYKKDIRINKNKTFIPIFLSILCIVFWFLKIPTLRYGYLIILIFLIEISSFFVIKNTLFFKKKSFIYIMLTSIFLLNIHNLNRIGNEMKRDDANYFKSFPWYYLPERKYKKVIKGKNFYFVQVDNLKYPCWNIPAPCLESSKTKFIFKENYNLAIRVY